MTVLLNVNSLVFKSGTRQNVSLCQVFLLKDN